MIIMFDLFFFCAAETNINPHGNVKWAIMGKPVVFSSISTVGSIRLTKLLCRSVLGTVTIKASGYILDVGGIILFCCMRCIFNNIKVFKYAIIGFFFNLYG